MKVFFILISVVLSMFLIGGCLFAQPRGERLRQILGKSESRSSDSQEIKVGETTRSYIIRVPEGGKEGRLPMVIVLHGGGGNGEIYSRSVDFERNKNYIVVYPNGSGRNGNNLLTWNAIGCCAYAVENSVDDIGFISALIDKLSAQYPVDPKRIYVTGHSNGAMMAYRIGVELGDKLAGIAVVSGSIFDYPAKPKAKIPVLIIHGTADQNVPYDGGTSKNSLITHAQTMPFRSVNEASSFWAKNNGCDLKPDKTSDDKIIRETFRNCSGGNDVEVLSIIGGGHAWPGGKAINPKGDKASSALDATDTILAFFDKHRKS